MAADQDVIREFLVSCGFQVNETEFRKFKVSIEDGTKVVLGLGAAAVAAAAAVVASVKVMSSQMESLYYASQRTGETAGNLMALRYAAGQIGLTADQAQGALEGFAQALRLNPGKEGLLAQLGVTGAGPLDKFQSFIEKSKTMAPYVAAAYAQLYGIDPQTLQMLQLGYGKLQASENEYRSKLGVVGLNPERAARAGVDFDNSLRTLGSDVQIFLVLLQERLAPVLAELASRFEKWEFAHAQDVVRKIADAIEAIGNWFLAVDWDKAGRGIDSFLTKAGKVVDAISKIVGWVSGGDQSKSSTPGDDDKPTGNGFLDWLHHPLGRITRDGASSAPEYDGSNFGEIDEVDPQAPRGIRNNNLGNIRYGKFAQQNGATGKDSGGFAIFSSMADGMKAAMTLLGTYLRTGRDTIEKVISSWAPGSENNTAAYIAAVEKATGLKANARLSGKDIPNVADAIFSHENGAAYASAFANARLGSTSSGSGGAPSVTQKTDIHVSGADNPQATAAAVASAQRDVNAGLVRNFAGAVS